VIESGAAYAELSRNLARRLDAPDEFAALTRACAQLLSQTGQHRPPVSLKSIGRALGIEYEYEKAAAGNEEASLSFSDGRMRLHISRNRFRSNPRRARFSIAHEMAHVILIRALGPGAIDAGESDRASYEAVERLCDFAASHLLLPREQLAAALRERGIGRGGTWALTTLFEVSQEALFRSIADLVPDGSVLLWRRYRRNAREDLTWRVWGSYTPLHAISNRPWLPRGCTLKHLAIGHLLDHAEPDRAVLARDVELQLNGPVTRHDLVATRWSDSYRQISMDGVSEASRGRPQEFTSDCLVTVLGRKDRVDPRLFQARS